MTVGDGQDLILADLDTRSDKHNELHFKDGVAPQDVQVAQSGDHLVLSIVGTADRVTVTDYFRGRAPSNVYNPVQAIRFADGTAWGADAIKLKLLAPSEAAQTVLGFEDSGDYLFGAGGNDRLEGLGGDDTLEGGTGDDTISGAFGNDTYLFGRGDGQDVILDDTEIRSDKYNVLQFKAGVAPQDVQVARSGNSLVLSLVGTGDRVSVNSFFYQDDPGNRYNPVQAVKFADGTVWNTAQIVSQLPVYASSSATLGHEQKDLVLTGSTNASGTGNALNNNLTGNTGSNVLLGLAGDDVLQGLDGDDTLHGGTGRDTLEGGSGQDTYLFNAGDGADTVVEGGNAVSDNDTLRLGAGLAASQTLVARAGNDVVLTWSGNTADSVTIKGVFAGTEANLSQVVERVVFSDGATWGFDDLVARLSVTGTGAADTLAGLVDTLDGGDGADTLTGGQGADALNGGAGSDVYVFNTGDGADSITDADTTAGNNDTLRLGTGLTVAKTEVSRAGNDMVLKWTGNTADSVTVKGVFNGNTVVTTNAVETVAFAEGVNWTFTDLMGRLVQSGTTGNDTMAGLNGYASTLRGLAGNDTLNGSTLADTLEGGTGSDALNGGAGNDVYVFNVGDGLDTITDVDATAGNNDTLRLSDRAADMQRSS